MIFRTVIAHIEERWYGDPEVSGSSPGPVKVFFANFSVILFFVCIHTFFFLIPFYSLQNTVTESQMISSPR